VLFNWALALANRESGKVLTTLLWQSEGASHWYRNYSAEAADDKVTSVERYEVLYSEIEEAYPWPPTFGSSLRKFFRVASTEVCRLHGSGSRATRASPCF
jgi:hypothetical protein